jgi:hypothetical protein
MDIDWSEFTAMNVQIFRFLDAPHLFWISAPAYNVVMFDYFSLNTESGEEMSSFTLAWRMRSS